jgi:hypothetical protein
MKYNELSGFKFDTMQLLATLSVILLTISSTTDSASSNVDPAGCAIDWHIEDQTSAIGGQFIANIQTQDECQQYCIDMPKCVACEWDYSDRPDTHGCWYHDNIQDLDELYNGNNVRHFQIKSSCPNSRNGVVPQQVLPPASGGRRLCSFDSGILAAALTTAFVLLAKLWNH